MAFCIYNMRPVQGPDDLADPTLAYNDIPEN